MKNFTGLKNVIGGVFLAALSITANAQNNVGIGTNTPDPSAALEVQSINQGVLIPRMNTVGMNAIAAPAPSLIIYNTDSNCYCFYNGSTLAWQSLCHSLTAGPAGPTGVAGATGATGPADTVAGPAGPTGPAGATGAASVVPGPTGPTGAGSGTPGPTGPTGAASVVPGPTGPTGAGSGTPGPTGPTGAASVVPGPTGPTGPNWTLTTPTFNANGTVTVNGTAGSGGPVTTASAAWLTTGNNPVAGTNFIGSINGADFITKTTNVERMRITAAGLGVYNNTAPLAGDVFSVYSNNMGGTTITNTLGASAINGYANGGTGVFGEDVGGGDGVVGYNNDNTATGGIGIFGEADGQTIAIEGYAPNKINGTGVSGYAPANGLGIGVWGTDSAGFSGVVGNDAHAYNGVSVTLAGSQAGGSFTGVSAGLTAYAYSNSATPLTQGGFFQDSINKTHNIQVSIAAYMANTAYKVYSPSGTAAVSTSVKDVNDKWVVMFAPEAPEVQFEDYGQGELVNGEAKIDLDPTYAKNVAINDKHPLRVFIQLEGDCNGVYVTDKTATGFTVKELNKGTSNVKFSYHVVANVKDAMVDGEVASKFQDLRFPPCLGVQQTARITRPKTTNAHTAAILGKKKTIK